MERCCCSAGSSGRSSLAVVVAAVAAVVSAEDVHQFGSQRWLGSRSSFVLRSSAGSRGNDTRRRVHGRTCRIACSHSRAASAWGCVRPGSRDSADRGDHRQVSDSTG
jgi:hypothetical protein